MTKLSKSPKILCVDDDRIINKLLSHFLERQGFEVRTANNGQEAIEIAQEWLPDLIITDLMMPIMDGFQTTAALRADPGTRHIPIVAFTAMPEANALARAQEVGIDRLVPKPSLSGDLFKIIQAYLSGQR